MKRKSSHSVAQLIVDDLTVELTRKQIKNVYLRVANPGGQVRMSVPRAMPERDVVRFVRDHRQWIRQRQAKVASLPISPEYQFVTGEIHQVFGRDCRLVVIEMPGRPIVRLFDGSVLEMQIPTGSDESKRRAIIESWYRDALRDRIPGLIAHWEPVMGVSVEEWRIRRMRTRWGTCNIRERRIWLNLELARRPEQCLEYVVVHELNHLLERGHTRRFYTLMDQWLPDWRATRQMLSSRGSEPD